MSAQQKHPEEISPICIVDAPCDVELTEKPFGPRWGQQVVTLGPEHLAALQAGKMVAVDVLEEYVIFLQSSAHLENSKREEAQR